MRKNLDTASPSRARKTAGIVKIRCVRITPKINALKRIKMI